MKNYKYNYVPFGTLLGKTFTKVTGGVDDSEIIFTVSDKEFYKLHHSQNCCESVSLQDMEGSLQDLVGNPILVAEESGSDDGPLDKWDESYSWTFYKLATIKGFVDMRWYGTSNGYYSEDVDLVHYTIKE